MANLRNTSSLSPGSAVRALEEGFNVARGGGTDVQDLPIVVTTAAVCSGIGIFYVIGRLMKNPEALRASILLAVAVSMALRNAIRQTLSQYLPVSVYYYLVGTLILQVGTASVIAIFGLKKKVEEEIACDDDDRATSRSFLRPMVFPSRTTHTRVVPQTHSFAYSYFLVGVPISLHGTAGALLSVGADVRRQGWLSVRAEDYMARGSHDRGLKGKLDDYLLSQGVPADRYPFAYLVTAPRFLGFSFNPVSFWYLYDNDERLAAMILEVNNTFDERRMYLMEHEKSGESGLALQFSNTWSKDFHVSPFNDRKGSYHLTTTDIWNGDLDAKIDNRIVLRNKEGKATLVAKVFSTEAGVDPSHMSTLASLYFLMKWSWVGFMTNLRILKEARVLWLKNLQVYYRPEVFKTSIGRMESAQEAEVEPVFRSLLADLVRDTSDEFGICYQPAAGPERGRKIYLHLDRDPKSLVPSRILDVQVLTPAFYGEIVRGNTVQETLIKTCFQASEGEAMLFVSDHPLLQEKLEQRIKKSMGGHSTVMRFSIRQLLTIYLRNRGKETLFRYCLNVVGNVTQNALPMSELDLFARGSRSNDAYEAYLHHANMLLLSDQIAFGFGSVLNFYQIAVYWICIVQICRIARDVWLHGWQMHKVLSLILCALLSHGSTLYWV